MTAEPMNPAGGVSGPGRFSKRTDTLPSAYYGEGTETQQIQAGATEAKTRGIADNVGGRPRKLSIDLFGQTERPDEPITVGAAAGPGPGPEILGMPRQSESLSQILGQLLPYDTNGEIAALYEQAVSRGF
jgi:hypothetical protein